MVDASSVISAVLTLVPLGILLLSVAITILPRDAIRRVQQIVKHRNDIWDDGKDFKPLTKQQKEKILRRQQIEQKRQQETLRQQKERDQQQSEQYRKESIRAAREKAEAEAVFEAFMRMLEAEYHREQMRRRAQWDEQEARRYRQQQQSTFKQQQHNSSNQQARARFAGMMGYGVQTVPEGCDGSVQEVLLAIDYYQVLGLSKHDATSDSLRTARKDRVLSVHPDKVGVDAPGANIAVGRVNVAYEVLSNSQIPSEYDAWLATQQRRANRSATVS